MQQFISKLSKNEKLILYVAIPIILLALLDMIVFGPTLKKISNLDEARAAKEAMIEDDLKFLSYTSSIEEEANRLQRYVAIELEDHDVVNHDFLSKIEQLANEANLLSVKSNPGEIQQKDGYTEYYTDIDCIGALQDIVTFMYEVNAFDKDLLKVVRFTVRPKRGEEDEINASLTIVKMVVNPLTAASAAELQ